MHFQKNHEWRGSAIMYRQHYTFNNRCARSVSDLKLSEQGSSQSRFFLSQLSVFFFFFSILTSAWFTEASTDSKTQQSVILQWQEQREGSSACSDALLSCMCSLQCCSPPQTSPQVTPRSVCHLMQLDSVTTMGLKWIFSSQTYNLPPFTCEETAKSLDLLVLKSPLNLWKASPEDQNLPWETICNETNSEEIRSL